MSEISEIIDLLTFFSTSQSEQIKKVPAVMKPVIVDAEQLYFQTDKPLRILSAILYSHLHRLPRGVSSKELVDILADIRVLLHWMLESDYSTMGTLDLFSVDDYEPDSAGNWEGIWKVLQRLCRIALNSTELSDVAPREFSFDYYVDRYTYEGEI